MKTLHLTLKLKWFDMIQSGEKREEYREIKPYWVRRLMWGIRSEFDINYSDVADILNGDSIMYNESTITEMRFDKFNFVTFRHGYATDAPEITLPIESITIGEGKPEWGAEPGKKYFVIKFKEGNKMDLELIDQLIKDGKTGEAAKAILESDEARNLAIEGALSQGNVQLAVKLLKGTSND